MVQHVDSNYGFNLGVNLHQIILLFVNDIFVVEQNPEQQIVHSTQEHLVERLLRAVLPVVTGDVHGLYFVPDVQLSSFKKGKIMEKNHPTWIPVG